MLLGLVAGGLALLLAAVCFELALPGVRDAPARVRARLRDHHAQFAPPPLPSRLATSVVAVEDEHFYSNVFVDVSFGIARASVAALERGGDPGGSTIAQQLAKEVYPHGSGVLATLEELGLGIKLSLVYSKHQILNMYLNAVYYGNGYWGERAAARGYFGVSPNRLSWAEATLLAGLIQGPQVYNPFHHYHRAKARQHHVIDQLVDNHDLSATDALAVFHQHLPFTRS